MLLYQNEEVHFEGISKIPEIELDTLVFISSNFVPVHCISYLFIKAVNIFIKLFLTYLFLNSTMKWVLNLQ